MLNKISEAIRSFKKSESGAVTVDWVVLTAAVVLLAGAVTTVLTSSDTGIKKYINDNIFAKITAP